MNYKQWKAGAWGLDCYGSLRQVVQQVGYRVWLADGGWAHAQMLTATGGED